MELATGTNGFTRAPSRAGMCFDGLCEYEHKKEDRIRIAIAQLNPVVGNIGGNLDRIWDVAVDLALAEPDLIVFPELCLTGYPPRDLLLRDSFIEQTQTAIDELAAATAWIADIGILLGAPLPTPKESGTGVYNCAVLLHDGEVRATQPKSLLPEYDVFDESDVREAVQIGADHGRLGYCR